ncbi:class I adenylate-forming enzyme family protein [Pararhizobium mangrovi]|uniref:class I adenylate-forming enzyme family protein n=1 Tax=Pararhizobium mangrovi TaxID=2590452 RepID=UPI0015E86796|nr:AMP-binding protein [Pararhizobium mangrovi]
MNALPPVFPSVVHMLQEAAERAPTREAIVCDGDRLSYDRFARSVARMAEELVAAGTAGGRVAILLPNSVDLAIAMLGALAAGAQAVPLNPVYTAHELVPILEDAAPTVILAANGVADAIEPAMCERGLPVPQRVGPGARRLIAGDEDAYILPLPDPDALGLLQYTGGTTGRPKGVELTNRATAINVAQREAVVPTTPDVERALLMTPLYHVYATAMGLFLTLNARGTLVVMSRYTPELALAAIEEEGITFFAGSPTIYHGLLACERIATTDFSSLELCFSGASALPAETLRRWKEITGCSICEGFGQTETGPVLAANPRLSTHKAGSVGVLLPRTKVEIVDIETGAALPLGETGEICAAGPQIMHGYRNLPEETAEALRNGWLHTGDVGHMDADGYLHVTGRRKEMVVVSGFNVFPREIEDALYAHPAVREVAAFGVPHTHKGEVLHVHAVCEKPSASIDDLMAFLAERLVRYKLPARLVLVESLPKTAIGKIDKAALQRAAKES